MTIQVSVLIHTASKDTFLSDKGISSYFYAVLKNLSQQQNSPTFEVCYCDRWFGRNLLHHEEVIAEFPFQIKHIPLHHQHRYFADHGYCHISAAKNTGLLYADGELCISFDDAEFFPNDLLSKYWRHYKQGYYLGALHKRLRAWPHTKEAEYINDSRWSSVNDYGMFHPVSGTMYAGTSFSLEDALSLNGFDEAMDGAKSLEDSDFANRMIMYGRKFILDESAYLWILDHQSYSDDFINCGLDDKAPEAESFKAGPERTLENFIAIENHGLLMAHKELQQIEVNKQQATDAQMKIVQRETIKYRNFDPLAPENAEKLAIWRGVPCFDLREQRQQLRNSAEWRW